MSQEVPCYLTHSVSIIRSLTTIVLPWHIDATRRIHKRKQNSCPRLVVGVGSSEQDGSRGFEWSLLRFRRVEREVDDPVIRAAAETLGVSVSLAISASASSSDPPIASSSTGGSKASFPTNASATDTGTASVVLTSHATMEPSPSVTADSTESSVESSTVSSVTDSSSMADPLPTQSIPQSPSALPSPLPSSAGDGPATTVSSPPVTTTFTGPRPTLSTPEPSSTSQSPSSTSERDTPTSTVISSVTNSTPTTLQSSLSTPQSPASSPGGDAPMPTISSVQGTTSVADPQPTPSALQPSFTPQPSASSSRRDTPSPTTSVFPSSTSSSPVVPTPSTPSLSSVDPGGSSAPALPPETSTTSMRTSTLPISTMSDPNTTDSSPVGTSAISIAIPTRSFSTIASTSASTPASASPSPLPSVLTSSSPSLTTQPLSSTSFQAPDSSTPVQTPESSTVSWSVTKLTTITTVFTTTLSNGRTTTVSTVVETGMLSTDVPKPSGFARHTGAIIGVALSATFALILIVVLIFFACKRYKARRSYDGSMEDILAMAREVAWRPPLDDDDSYLAGYQSRPPLLASGSQGNGAEGAYDDQGAVLVGDHQSAEGGGHYNAEGRGSGLGPMLSPAFGGRPYMPGFEPGQQGTASRTRPTNTPPTTEPETAQVWWGVNDPQAVSDETPRPVGGGGHPVSGLGSRSAASLTMVGGSSSGGHGGSSSADHNWRTTAMKRSFISGPRPLSSGQTRRYSSTPPTAFVNASDPALGHEQQLMEHPGNATVKGFLSRLRNGQRESMQSIATIRGPSETRSSDELDMSSAALHLYSPSLLNPPIVIMPSNTHRRTSRGLTGNSGAPPPLCPPQSFNQDQGFSAYPSSTLWTPVSLPPSPSPTPTDDSSMVEGLLHPRLGMMKLGPSRQASTASLRDNEDYTRPINGLVNNHLRSTTTFETRDTVGL